MKTTIQPWQHSRIFFLHRGDKAEGRIITEAGWYWSDECDQIYGGPCTTKEAAALEQQGYAESLGNDYEY